VNYTFPRNKLRNGVGGLNLPKTGSMLGKLLIIAPLVLVLTAVSLFMPARQVTIEGIGTLSFETTVILSVGQKVAYASPDDTGWSSPTASVTPNQFTNPDSAFTSNDSYATVDTDNKQQGYGNFGIPTIPTGATINGIEVQLEAKTNIEATTRHFQVALSWFNGTSWNDTDWKDTLPLTTTDAIYTVGGSADTWGRTSWSPGEFTNANFRVKVKAQLTSSQITLRPNAVGTYQQWSTYGTGTAHWDRTSDQNDATGVEVTGSTVLKEAENLGDRAQTGTINAVTAYMRAKASGRAQPEKAVILWRTGDSDYESSEFNINRGNFKNESEPRTTNPNTDSAWTWAEVNALEIGSRATTLDSTETIQVSEYWIVVEVATELLLDDLRVKVYYTPPPPPLPAVGGDVRPINKAGVLAPWLGLILILAIGGGIFALRRRRAH